MHLHLINEPLHPKAYLQNQLEAFIRFCGYKHPWSSVIIYCIFCIIRGFQLVFFCKTINQEINPSVIVQFLIFFMVEQYFLLDLQWRSILIGISCFLAIMGKYLLLDLDYLFSYELQFIQLCIKDFYQTSYQIYLIKS
ncbi:transmembrane protein, putative (macronuclear) [Tetrahymena thermophila SB210]|uniref:Transmembrane protein, putative n=1 Tax=Tetrahymena thermophila (strain SB210) TaxID=312017 RepID=W7WWA4_TETTS|nr:transmembrane protein, putative [Tetrahymena thermophila SB210]EWS71115.1 transmembrane protein, putative [Tetrahymena thermophila SB210]|eukprot:XP_012656358.1 transmembrane protein, putative [Tetrahymena thermophila SB210]